MSRSKPLVRGAAIAASAAALGTLGWLLSTAGEQARSPEPISGAVAVSSDGLVVARDEGESLPEPSGDGLALIAVLRDACDVEGLLAQARGTRERDDPALRRQGVVALASLAAIPTPEAETALQAVAEDNRAPSLERTTALGALWERGARDYVAELGDRSADPAIRSKARALEEAFGRKSGGAPQAR